LFIKKTAPFKNRNGPNPERAKVTDHLRSYAVKSGQKMTPSIEKELKEIDDLINNPGKTFSSDLRKLDRKNR